MDPEFINALPEDLRQEVITQYVRDQRRALQPSAPENLNEEFLNALPFEIREEVIEFERMETERRQRPERVGNEQIRPPTSAGRLIRPGELRAVVPKPTSTGKKIIESVQLIDKSGLVSLM
jgi:E3 ubiquitin-protein ligase HUWE1